MLLRSLLVLGGLLLGEPVPGQDPEPRELPAFLGPLKKPVAPGINPMSDAKIELGRMLYHDARLSGNGSLSCASCHQPAKGFADGLPKGVGSNGVLLGRGSPTLLNAAYFESQFWDGRAETLEDQAKGPIQADKEMNNTPEKVVATLAAIPGYTKLFQEAFGGGPTFDRVAQAIASFERILVDLDSPFDRWARGDDEAMSDAQKRGLDLFSGKARCAVCHSGSLFSDKRFHNTGLDDGDEGRIAVTKDPADQGVFKTPSVRNAAITAPYMHNGRFRTLREVIDHYEKVSNDREKHPGLSIFALPFRLEEAEKSDLEAFIHALTGDRRDPRAGVVPELPK